MERGIAFSTREALHFGWTKSNANLGTVLLLGLVGAFLAMLNQALSRQGGAGFLLAIPVQVLQAAVALALLRVALKLHDGEPIDLTRPIELVGDFFGYLLTSILYGLIVIAGVILLIVPGILWAIQYGFAVFLVADEKLDPVAALRESARLTSGVKGQLFGFGLLLLAVNLLGALALGIGLLFTIPMTVIAATYVYRRLQARAGKRSELTQAPLSFPHAPGATLLCVLLTSLALAACAPGLNEQIDTVNAQGVLSGFWRGLWHGAIVPITFVVSLFSSNVHIYEVHNNGGWYDFGYLVGLLTFCGGGACGGAAQRRRSRSACRRREAVAPPI